MILNATNTMVKSSYTSPSNQNSKEVNRSSNVVVSQQGDKNKIDRVKDSIASGEYKVDLEALSQKIADELLLWCKKLRS